LFKGRTVSTLARRQVHDRRERPEQQERLRVQEIKRTVTVTGVAFVGKHTGKVSLSAGKWVFTPGVGART